MSNPRNSHMNMGEDNEFKVLQALVNEAYDRSMNRLLNAGGLAIKAGASALAKTVNTIYYMIAGALYSKAAGDMPALSGTVTNAKFNVFVFVINAAGTITRKTGTQASTLAGVVFPSIERTEVVIGILIVNPTGTGNFVGGTTALDDGTVVPNAVYIDTIGMFRPSLGVSTE